MNAAIEDRRTASRAAAILALIEVVDLPIIHYSVKWWNTLHQGPTFTKLGAPSIHPSMLAPLLVMAFAFTGYYLALMLVRARCELLTCKGLHRFESVQKSRFKDLLDIGLASQSSTSKEKIDVQ